MASDPATATVVLFGGKNRRTAPSRHLDLGRHDLDPAAPGAPPPGLFGASMAYDAATGTVVLFGGVSLSKGAILDDTWTWDGTTWARQDPAHHPSARLTPAMASDPATGTAVLFGGCCLFHDTWTWG